MNGKTVSLVCIAVAIAFSSGCASQTNGQGNAMRDSSVAAPAADQSRREFKNAVHRARRIYSVANPEGATCGAEQPVDPVVCPDLTLWGLGRL